MQTKLTYSQLAKALGGIPPATVANNVNRGKLFAVIEGKKKYVDITDKVNADWIQTYCINNGKEFDINNIFKKKEELKPNNPVTQIETELRTELNQQVKSKKHIPKTPDKKTKLESMVSDEAKSEVADLALKKMKLEVKNLANKDKKDRLQIQKIQGELIPFDAARDVFLYAIESYRATFLQNINSLSNIFSQRLGADHAQFVQIQKQIAETVKDITEQSKETILNGLEGVVKEYSDVRSRGERK